MKEKIFDSRDLRERVLDGEISCCQIVEDSLAKINEGSAYNAFISVFGNKALRRARRIDEKIARDGKVGLLAGMVLGIKDNIAVKGTKTTCGSLILQNYVSPYNATVVEKLLAEDAVLIGKTNMDEFAMGSSNETSRFGPVFNPHKNDRVAGGSSGGAAAAVAAGLIHGAVASDTGGSIRQPASFCGVVGYKPSYGLLSRFGLIAFASSLDHIGPLARSVKECALLTEIMSGRDPLDATSIEDPAPPLYTRLDELPKQLTVGLPVEYFTEGLNPEVKDAVLRTASALESCACTIKEISLPHTRYAIATYYIIATAEASSNLARYDGTRYGSRRTTSTEGTEVYESAEGTEGTGSTDLDEMYFTSRSRGFGREVQRRILLGTYVLSAGYYAAYYEKAQKVRTLLSRDFAHAFEEVDIILTPTSPHTAFTLGERTEDPLSMYLSDVYTVSANLAGLPAISVPCGFNSANLPIGAQIIGKTFDDATVLQAAHLVEQTLPEK